MNKFIFSLAGAVTVLASTIALIDYKKRWDCKLYTEPPMNELLLVFATAASGTILAAIGDQLDETKYPKRTKKLQKADDKLMEIVAPKK